MTDESTCRRAAQAYAELLRRWVTRDWVDRPVLVVRVGRVYLVDDLRARDKYWEVMIFDVDWTRLAGYGGGH
ncbi:MAG: hypothetical protein ACREMA_01395 [Longimicrobiales bacterium]